MYVAQKTIVLARREERDRGMSHHWGYVAALCSALLFGVSTTVNKILLESVSPLTIASLTYVIGGIFLGTVNFLPKKASLVTRFKLPSSAAREPTWKDGMLLLLVALFGGVLAPSLNLIGLNNTTAVSTALLGNTETLFTIAIAFVFLGERGRSKDYAAMTLLIIGAVILTTNLNFHQLLSTGTFLGNVLVVLAAFCWGIDNNLSQVLSVKRSLLQVGSLKGIIGGGSLFAVVSLYGIQIVLSTFAISWLLILGVFSVGLSLLFFLFSLQQIGAMRTGVIFSTASLFGAVTAFFVLREPISLVQALAGCLMLIAIYVLAIPKRQISQNASAA
jgi:drug/metabolite transporter (DMT)-like permease